MLVPPAASSRQRAVTYGISTGAAATVALALWLQPWRTELVAPSPAPAASNHRVDLVFAVDTTGSMGGLLDGAKRTVWSIASHVREVDPQADLRVGLVAYRDLGDAYVTKDFALSADMDAVFAELSSYQAMGGGDIPEDVDAALYDAVHKMPWRSDAKKLIFLVGDAPPATRGDVPAFDVTAREAAERQITLNTIRCGDDPDTAAAWQRVATLGHGEFSTIEQNGGVQQVATPYDDKVRALSKKIDETAVIYGDATTRGAYEGKMAAAAAAPAATAADRGAYYAAKPMAKRASEDIVGGSVDVDNLEPAKLPAGMQGMTKGEIKSELARRDAERQEAQKQLAEATKQRAEYLKNHAAKGAKGFDSAVKATVEHELK